MIRKLVATSLLGLLVATGAQAAGVVPGSETAVRSQEATQLHAVATGALRAAGPAVLETQSFGYARTDGQFGGVPGSDRLDDLRSLDSASSGRGAGQIAPSLNTRTVPGSGSF